MLLVVFLGIYVASGVQVIHKAKSKRTAFLRWAKYTEMLTRGEIIYDPEMEQYPNLPMMALILMPFHAVGPMLCSYQERDLLAGLAIGLVAVLKVTPLLFFTIFHV